jgi:hypothetical protein
MKGGLLCGETGGAGGLLAAAQPRRLSILLLDFVVFV